MSLPVTALCQAASDDVTAEPEEIRRYTVELVVFEYAQAITDDREIFLPDEFPAEAGQARNVARVYGDPGTTFPGDETEPMDEAAPLDEDPLDFLDPVEAQEDDTLAEIPNHIIQTQLEVLDPAEHALKDLYGKLVALDAYRPIMRAAWTQATFAEEHTLPIRLRRVGNVPLRLDGIVKLYVSRYLHFVVDISLEAQPDAYGQRDAARGQYYGDRPSRNSFGFGDDEPALPVKYRISEDRIFKSGELRYYDHPKFGVLVRVTRVEEAEVQTDETFLLPGNH